MTVSPLTVMQETDLGDRYMQDYLFVANALAIIF